MKKWALITFISLWTLIMIGFSGSLDSRRTAVAWHNYSQTPNEVTLKALQDAKRSDRWEIVICELVLGGVLVWPVISLVRMIRAQKI